VKNAVLNAPGKYTQNAGLCYLSRHPASTERRGTAGVMSP